MALSSFLLDDDLEAYVRAHSPEPDELLRDLMAETAALPRPSMAVSPEQAAFLALLVKITGARRVLEVGTFTGMSSVAMARALPPDGSLLACDVSKEWTAIARRYWEKAGVADRIELRLGPAVETLATLPKDPTFDLAFVDADKGGYPDYLELIVPRLHPGGLLVADNVLRRGRVLDPDPHDESSRAIHRFNDLAAAHPDLETHLLAVYDGVLLARKT